MSEGSAETKGCPVTQGLWRSHFSAVHGELLSRLGFEFPGVNERAATCAQCRCAGAAEVPTYKALPRYQPHLKCCTFFPFVPNFLIGAILREKGRAAEVLRPLLVTNGLPIGLVPSIAYRERFAAVGSCGFGNLDDLACPFLDSMKHNCSIWTHRPTTCATHFCLSSFGFLGEEFWQRSEALLQGLDFTLAQEALLRCGFFGQELDLNLRYFPRSPGEPLPEELTPAIWRKAWQEFAAQPEEFYLRCLALIESFSADELSALISPGSTFEEIARALELSYRNIQTLLK